MQQGVRGAHRVVDLVGHHADELLVRGLFVEAQLLGQLLHQDEAARILAADPNVDGFMSSVGSGGLQCSPLSVER